MPTTHVSTVARGVPVQTTAIVDLTAPASPVLELRQRQLYQKNTRLAKQKETELIAFQKTRLKN